MCYGNILEDSMRRARKIHRCMECNRDIKPGQSYRRAALVDHGDFRATKECLECHVLSRAMIDLTGDQGEVCWDWGSIRPILRDMVRDLGAAQVRAAIREARAYVARQGQPRAICPKCLTELASAGGAMWQQCPRHPHAGVRIVKA